jgi:hypothetical protein
MIPFSLASLQIRASIAMAGAQKRAYAIMPLSIMVVCPAVSTFLNSLLLPLPFFDIYCFLTHVVDFSEIINLPVMKFTFQLTLFDDASDELFQTSQVNYVNAYCGQVLG